MNHFLAQNSSAVFGLVGIIIRCNLVFAGWWFLRKRGLQLRLRERFWDRSIIAHENIVGLAINMRAMVPLGGLDSSGGVAHAPEVMTSREMFDQWLAEFGQTCGPATTWLSTAAKRELNFVQDYFVTLHTDTSKVPSKHLCEIGAFGKTSLNCPLA